MYDNFAFLVFILIRRAEKKLKVIDLLMIVIRIISDAFITLDTKAYVLRGK